MHEFSSLSCGKAAGSSRIHGSVVGFLCAAGVLLACDPSSAPVAPAAPPRQAAAAALTTTPGTPAHALYAEKGFTCVACHPCGTRSPDGHASSWMDQANTGFHASAANQNLAGCRTCHGPELDGLGGSTVVSCAQCHGAAWRSNCTMCHGGADGPGGAPPKATWGNGADPVRVGAHTAHVAAAHGLAQPVSCAACHPVPADALGAGHADGTVSVAFTGIAAQGTHPPAAWDRGQATCANTYCHGATLGGGALTTPVWTAADGSYRACGACHGAPPPPPHSISTECGSCHAGYTGSVANPALHLDGKLDVNAMTCTSCHGSGLDPAPPLGTRGETLTTARAVGAHQAHLVGGRLAAPLACQECHPVPIATGHADGAVQLAFGPLASANGAAPAFDGTTLTCANYCHGQTLAAGGANTTPLWTQVDGTQAACGTCHGAPPPPPHPGDPSCGSCHPGYSGTDVVLATHLNGNVEVTVSCNSCHGSAANAAPPTGTHGETLESERAVGAHQRHLAGGPLRGPMDCTECHAVPASTGHSDGAVQLAFGPLSRTGGATPGWDSQSLTCAGTYCHGSTLRGGGANQAPLWTGGASQAACGSCHGTPPPAPHPQTQICDSCHPGYTVTAVDLTKHINGRVEAENLTCSSCHGDNSRVLVSQADPLAIAAPPYGSRGETETTSRSVGQHQAHVSRGDGIALPNKCRYCHAVPTTFDHASGVPEVTFASLAVMDGATPSFDAATSTCSNTYCHGSTLGRGGTDHAPSWTAPAPVTCTTCHGAPPPAPHPQDADCIRCHPGYTSTTVRKATHVNGISDFPSGCNSCHDAPPNSGGHYDHLADGVACDRCHAGYTITSANPTLHRNAVQDVTLAGWDPARRTCSSIACHGSEYWGRTGDAARQSCNQCHGVPPRSGEHFQHSEYSCSRCHGTGYSTTTTNSATHMSGVVDVPYAFYDRATLSCSSAAGACHGSQRWGPRSPVTPNCSNCHGFPPPLPHPQQTACHSCHPSMQSTGVLTVDHNNGNLDISGAGCATCHGFPPVTTRSGGTHPTDANCYGCHSTTVDSNNQVQPNGTHNDGAVQVGGGGVGTYGCQSCHGDQARQAPDGADANVKAAPPLGTRGEREPTTRAVGAHLAHVNPASGTLAGPARCDECHPVPAAMNHANGVVVMQFGGRAILEGAAPAYEPVSGSCSASYCHGATLGAGGTNHAPAWTGGAAEAACGSCHDAPPPAPHTQSTNCGGCHEGYGPATVNLAQHVNGTVEVTAMACNSCHGNAQNAAPPTGTGGETAPTSPAVGAHQQHLSGGTFSGPLACEECHVVPTAMGHADGAVQLAFGPLARTGGAAPAWDPATRTCSASYCHGQFAGGALLNTPSWTTVDGTQAACGTCHGTPPPAPHTASTGCGGCHEGYTSTSVNLATHVNGTVEAVANPHPAGWSDPAQHGTQANLTGLAGCASCHDLTSPTSSCTTCHATAGFASWDTTCTFCHGDPATPRASPPVDIQGRSAATNVSVGVHAAHVTTPIASAAACAECHPARAGSVAADAGHVDGNGIAEVQLGALARTGGAAATYTRVSATSATCASTYCHGRFSGGVNSGQGATVNWTSTTQVTCTSCHGSPPSTGQHSKHRSEGLGCQNCHNAVASSSTVIANPALHVNGSDDVKFGGTWSGRNVAGSWNASTRTCSTLPCHGSERW